jgi:hypothetical protein
MPPRNDMAPAMASPAATPIEPETSGFYAGGLQTVARSSFLVGFNFVCGS